MDREEGGIAVLTGTKVRHFPELYSRNHTHCCCIAGGCHGYQEWINFIGWWSCDLLRQVSAGDGGKTENTANVQWEEDGEIRVCVQRGEGEGVLISGCGQGVWSPHRSQTSCLWTRDWTRQRKCWLWAAAFLAPNSLSAWQPDVSSTEPCYIPHCCHGDIYLPPSLMWFVELPVIPIHSVCICVLPINCMITFSLVYR